MGNIVDSAAKKKQIRQRTLISYYIEFIIIKEGLKQKSWWRKGYNKYHYEDVNSRSTLEITSLGGRASPGARIYFCVKK